MRDGRKSWVARSVGLVGAGSAGWVEKVGCQECRVGGCWECRMGGKSGLPGV